MTNSELNLACARAMGWPERSEGHDLWGHRPYIALFAEGPHVYPLGSNTWNPAEAIEDAWVLLERMRDSDCDVAIESCGAAWCVVMYGKPCESAKTAPLAICEAFLAWAKAGEP